MRFPFLPREEKFFGLFNKSAENMHQAANALNDLVTNWELVGSKVAEITEIEHRGDTITHDIIAQLHRTFIPPFDREDIALLAHTMDDIVDFIHAAADAMFIYKVEEPTERARELAEILVRAVTEVETAVRGLGDRARLKNVLTNCVEINRLENMADRVFRMAMSDLFEADTDVARIIKWREIYEHMEAATDRCEDVANVIEGVALKHA